MMDFISIVVFCQTFFVALLKKMISIGSIMIMRNAFRRNKMLNSYLRHRMADQKIDDITELMRLSGVTRNTINKLYRNSNLETVKIETLIRLCDALKCNLSDLIEYTYESKE